MNNAANAVVYEALKNYYLNLPHCQAIGLQFEQTIGTTPILSVPYQACLQAEQHSQRLHGGVMTTLMDVTCATAVSAHLSEVEALATLDLRMDYLQDALEQAPIFGRAQCHQLNDDIAFVHGTCYQASSQPHIIATATATFIRTILPTDVQQIITKAWIS